MPALPGQQSDVVDPAAPMPLDGGPAYPVVIRSDSFSVDVFGLQIAPNVPRTYTGMTVRQKYYQQAMGSLIISGAYTAGSLDGTAMAAIATAALAMAEAMITAESA